MICKLQIKQNSVQMIQTLQFAKGKQNKNKTQFKKNFYPHLMATIPLIPVKEDKSKSSQNQTLNLPRFNKEFIGIGHQLQQKKKQRRRIQQEQKTMANRVIYLQKQQLKAQQNLKKKKSQLNKMMQAIQRTSQQKLQVIHFFMFKKQHMRRIKQLQLQALVQQNRNRRLAQKQAQQSARYSLQNQKHNTYSRIKSFIKEKQQEKQDFLFDDIKNKKDRWLSLNIDKEKGKQKIDMFYRKKNAQHTLNYMQKIQKQEATKMLKMDTIKHLQVFENALKKKLQKSTSRISQVQQKILQNSRSIEERKSLSSQKSSELLIPTKTNRKFNTNLASYTIQPSNPEYLNELNISFEKEANLSEKAGSLTERKKTSNKLDEEEIEQKIGWPNVEDIQLSTFKIIRTVKKRTKHNQNKFKPYQLI